MLLEPDAIEQINLSGWTALVRLNENHMDELHSLPDIALPRKVASNLRNSRYSLFYIENAYNTLRPSG